MSKFTAALGRKAESHDGAVVAFRRTGDGGFVVTATPRAAQPATRQTFATVEIDGPELSALVQLVAGMIPTPAEKREAKDERHDQVLAECERLIARNGELEQRASDYLVYRRTIRDALAPILEAASGEGR